MLDKMKLLKSELIGLTTTVVDSDNKANIGIKGKIIDETKNMIIVKTEKGIKKLIKEQNKMKFGDIIIDGKELAARPEERIKLGGKT